MVDHKIILGYVPVRRDMFPAQAATAMEKKIRARVKDILSQQHDVQLITIDAIVPDGILWSNACVEKIEALFRAKKVDAVFFPTLQLRAGGTGRPARPTPEPARSALGAPRPRP